MPDREFETSPVQMVACRSEVSIDAPLELVFAVLTRRNAGQSNLTIRLTPSNRDNRDDTSVVLVFVVVIPTGDESGAAQSLALMWKGFLRRLKAIAEASSRISIQVGNRASARAGLG